MAAFDRVLSGIPQMDENFDNIRMGDNVVWRVAQTRLFFPARDPRWDSPAARNWI